MPNCLRTVLLPPSQPTRYRVLILVVFPSAYLTSASTPAASCEKLVNSHPKRTSAFGRLSTADFSSGSGVYCERSWEGARGIVPSLQRRPASCMAATDG